MSDAPSYSEAIEPFIEAAGRASSRSRYILIAIIFTSVAIFGGAWNQRDASWFETTNLVRKHELEYLAALKDQRTAQIELEDCSSINSSANALLQVGRKLTLSAPYGGALASSIGLRHCGPLTAEKVNQVLQACEASVLRNDSKTKTSCVSGAPKKSISHPEKSPPVQTTPPCSCCDAATEPLDQSEQACNGVVQLQALSETRKGEAGRNLERLNELLTSSELARGKAYVERGHLVLNDGDYSKLLQDEAKSDFEQAQRLRYEQEILIKIPLFGTTFHLNDLGILGGFAITVLLIWLRTSIQEEVNGLKIARKQTEEFSASMAGDKTNFKKRVYYLLSTQQFFFPPRLSSAPTLTVSQFLEDNSLRLVLLLLALMPWLIELGLFIEDCGAPQDIEGDNPLGFALTLHVSLFFLFVNALLLLFTVVSGIRLVKAWEDLAKNWVVQPEKP